MFINGYYIATITLLNISGYSLVLYQWLLVAMISMTINGYDINGYWWIFYYWILVVLISSIYNGY